VKSKEEWEKGIQILLAEDFGFVRKNEFGAPNRRQLENRESIHGANKISG
jgi:hypothetical protein